jgi:type I restriction enzyme S subunit
MKIDDKTSHNSPSLRFPEFTGEWEYFSINDVCSEFKSGKNIKADLISSNGNFPVYGGNGLRGYTSSYNHDGLYVLIGRQGALCGNVRSVFGKIYITEHAIAVAGNEKSDTNFLHYLFLKMNLGQYSDQSAQPGLAVNKLLKLKVLLPSISEQIKIAKLLSLLDERIAVQSRLIEDLKKLRCAIVEKMFKQSKANGRLGDFIEQVSVRNKNGLYSNVLSVSNKQGFVKQSEQFEDRTVASEDTSNYKIVKRNNFAYNPARINVGSIARLTKFDVGIVSPMYVCFRTKASIIPEYMEAFFTSQQFFYEMMKRLEGSVRLCLSYEGLCNIPVYIPDMNKQIAMGQNISLILSKIGLEIEYLGRLHQQKQYLLRKMFI